MIETIILEEPAARERYRTAPCLEEREQYLFHLMRQGYGPDYLRTVSGVNVAGRALPGTHDTSNSRTGRN